MTTYSTPGVFVEEISTFPPSVAEVSTAVPAFIGYTKQGLSASEGPKTLRINTLLEFEAAFGKAPASQFTLSADYDADNGLWNLSSLARTAPIAEYLLHYCLDMYFKNGGGSCYIISIGNYQDTPAKAHFEAGLSALEKEDEPTLILLPDALNLSANNYADYFSVCTQALSQCKKLGDRFVILDLPAGNNAVANFRQGIGINDLQYGAAYYPHLNTALNYQYAEADVSIQTSGSTAVQHVWLKSYGLDSNGIAVGFSSENGDLNPAVTIEAGAAADAVGFSVSGNLLTISNADTKTATDISAAWAGWIAGNDPAGFDIQTEGDGSGTLSPIASDLLDMEDMPDATENLTLAAAKSSQTGLYNQVRSALVGQRVVMPPSAAVAGVYARVDRDRGVWKAPANVSLASVIGPTTKITDEKQANLNVDATAGKSINAIRAFTGKGTLVWGARTLAGNDNEWRYVSVRRLFNMIEESSRKATAFAVFEPNDATTWLKVKAMIESYLFSLWERGALAGATSEDAYFVNVGLGKTMTPQDVLEGKMIVEIGVAAVRPAEFIVLRFSHKLQEA